MDQHHIFRYWVACLASVWPLDNMSLSDLPFPIAELTWEKFAEVQKHLKLKKAETFTIMSHVLGPKPDVAWLCCNLMRNVA